MPSSARKKKYNRCVGTRYCANNCPYKVRHFHWYDYAAPGGAWESWPDPLNMLLNPDVTFREDAATTEFYTLSLHDALPIWLEKRIENRVRFGRSVVEKIIDRNRRVLSFA